MVSQVRSRADARCLPRTHVSMLVRGAFLGWWPDVWAIRAVYLVK